MLSGLLSGLLTGLRQSHPVDWVGSVGVRRRGRGRARAPPRDPDNLDPHLALCTRRRLAMRREPRPPAICTARPPPPSGDRDPEANFEGCGSEGAGGGVGIVNSYRSTESRVS